MRKLLKNAKVVNVFTDSLEEKDVLLENGVILGIGAYDPGEADAWEDLSGCFLCPGLIDGHIHIESTMLSPRRFAEVALPHGTTTVVADPHEIANVAGGDGLRYMLAASEGLPLSVKIALPSCVPATPFDESGAILDAAALRPFYEEERVVSLGEVMNYPGVLSGEEDLLEKISDAKEAGRTINGHAPGLSGEALCRYISAGIEDDHECTDPEEGKERILRGQWVMIREGTAAKNLSALLPLFAEPWCRRCLLVTDDRHPADLAREGEVDHLVRQAIKAGVSPLTAIRMATLQAAEHFRIPHLGAVAPGYRADLLVLSDLSAFAVRDVYCAGDKVVSQGILAPLPKEQIPEKLCAAVQDSVHMAELAKKDFLISPKAGPCRVIGVIPGQLLTEEEHFTLPFTPKTNGIDLERDILKLAVAERHRGSGHIGIGYIRGIGLKKGAIASTVSHDSHNLIVIGTSEEEMAHAANRIRQIGGGAVVVAEGQVLAEMPLPIGGLMADAPAAEVAEQNRRVREAVHLLGAPADIEPFMNMSFVSLGVIPKLKMTTLGLLQVDAWRLVPLFVNED